MASVCKKPSDADLGALIFGKEFQPLMGGMKDCVPRNGDADFHIVKCVSEMLSVVNMLVMPAPMDAVQNAVEAGDFNGNKVLMEKVPEKTL